MIGRQSQRISYGVMVSSSLYFQTTISASASASTSRRAVSSTVKFSPKMVSTAAIRGRRPYMEDEFSVSDDNLYAAVFDGQDH
jgi:hypothetical protein